jgi:hypothetical protein
MEYVNHIDKLYKPCERDVAFTMPFVDDTDVWVYIAATNFKGNRIELQDMTYQNLPYEVPMSDVEWKVFTVGTSNVFHTYFRVKANKLPSWTRCNPFTILVFDNLVRIYSQVWKYVAAETVTIESRIAKDDCFDGEFVQERYFGTDVTLVSGDASVVATNRTRIRGKLLLISHNFDFTKFGNSTITRSDSTRKYEIFWNFIAPYFANHIAAILMRGEVLVNGEKYIATSKAPLTKIQGNDYCQMNLRMELEEIPCVKNHDCDTNFQFTPCFLNIESTIDTNETTVTVATATIEQESSIRNKTNITAASNTDAILIYNTILNATGAVQFGSNNKYFARQDMHTIAISGNVVSFYYSYMPPFFDNEFMDVTEFYTEIVFGILYPHIYSGFTFEEVIVKSYSKIFTATTSPDAASPTTIIYDQSLLPNAVVTGNSIKLPMPIFIPATIQFSNTQQNCGTKVKYENVGKAVTRCIKVFIEGGGVSLHIYNNNVKKEFNNIQGYYSNLYCYAYPSKIDSLYIDNLTAGDYLDISLTP